MGLVSGTGGSESRFRVYVEALTSALGHADRAKPFQSYCTGLMPNCYRRYPHWYGSARLLLLFLVVRLIGANGPVDHGPTGQQSDSVT